MMAQPTKKRKLGDEDDVQTNTWLEQNGSGTKEGPASNGNSQKNGHRNVSAARTNGVSRSGDSQILLSNGSFKSTLFKLQIDELLENVKWKHGRRAERIGTLLRQLKTVIDSIPDRGELPVYSLITRSGIKLPS